MFIALVLAANNLAGFSDLLPYSVTKSVSNCLYDGGFNDETNKQQGKICPHPTHLLIHFANITVFETQQGGEILLLLLFKGVSS